MHLYDAQNFKSSFNNMTLEDAGVETAHQVEIAKSSNKPLLIFGQGPVIDQATRQIAQDAETQQGQEDVNFWSKSLVLAAAELYRRKVADNFIVMGGKTGGQEYSSEAKLIGQNMEAAGIPAGSIRLEEESHDTLTNLVNFLNLYTNQDALVDELKISILATSYHIPRLRVLMQLFAIPVKDGFVADEVLRYAARSTEVPDHKTLEDLEQRLNMNYPQDFYSQQQGTEQRDIVDRSIKDDLWTRELLEYPAKWLPVVAGIKNDNRLRAIIEKVYTIYPKEQLDGFGLNPSDPPELTRSKLRQITYGGLESMGVDVNKWVEENKTQGWPPEIVRRLNKLHAERGGKRRLQHFLNQVEGLLKSGHDIGIAADFDNNISRQGPSKGLDPRDSFMDPVIRQAFLEMQAAGTDVVIISSRGARDIARIAGMNGVGIVGTLGWETLDRDGKSHIHPRFKPFQPYITAILREVREKFLTEQLHTPTRIPYEPNNELLTPDGEKIILQRKGYNEEYPEGINSTWALNFVSPDKRFIYQQALQNYYQEAFAKYANALSNEDKATLQEMCGFMINAGKTAEGLPTLDVEIRPISQGSKTTGLIQLMREPGDPKRQDYFQDMPFRSRWIYSGDHAEQDGTPMRAGRLAGVLTEGKRGLLGIWSKPEHEAERPIRGATIIVDSVSGNAQAMKHTASLISRYLVPSPHSNS